MMGSSRNPKRQAIKALVPAISSPSSRSQQGSHPIRERSHWTTAGFVERGREFDVDDGLHLWQADDGGFGDGGWAVEDASEVLSQSLYYLCLLSEEGTAVGAEERCSTFGGWTPLLHKATTAVESTSVIIGGAVDVGFVQAVLRDEQVAGGGVDVIEPVLGLSACATEDGRDRRLDSVPQLAPWILHAGVLVNGSGGRSTDWKFA
ncbi:hypothetical protein SprV_0702303800 [Sparganum proliferum]